MTNIRIHFEVDGVPDVQVIAGSFSRDDTQAALAFLFTEFEKINGVDPGGHDYAAERGANLVPRVDGWAPYPLKVTP